MADWVPKLAQGVELKALKLTATDGFVLSRVDGATSEKALVLLTGLPMPELAKSLERLEREGAIEPRVAPVKAASPPARDADPKFDPFVEGDEPEPEADEAPAAPPEDAGAAGTHRKLFETRLHALTEDERSSLAVGAVEPELSALCFDPLPSVVKQLLANPQVGPVHARLIAAHHANPVGLEALAGRAALLQDRQVQQLLLRNTQSPVHLIRRLLSARRLLDMYKTGQSRDLPDRNRRTSRELLRARFGPATAEEKVELIFATEGRALAALSGLSLDGKATSILCSRNYASVQLIQNLAHWAASPPPLIAHLLKQPLVRRMPQLKNLLMRHPNRPSSAV
jgi:hypothetical protein